MQFNLRDGPPSTWQRYGIDGDHDGAKDVYDPHDAIPSAANYVHRLLVRADGNLRAAILAYSHSES
jgi:membrane-bound lytic murein transglycosylase B